MDRNAEYVLTEHPTAGYGRLINRPTRVWVRQQTVRLLGPVPFEPNLVRVRLEDGSVRRVSKDGLTEIVAAES